MSAPPMVAEGSASRHGGYERGRVRKDHRSNFELWAWFFMRISGLFLIFLALYHLVWWNLVVGVEHLDAELVRERWANPFWRLFNVALIFFAMLHGLNGLRYSIEDYVRRPGLQVVVKTVLYSIVLGALAWGAWALFTFDPDVAVTVAREAV